MNGSISGIESDRVELFGRISSLNAEVKRLEDEISMLKTRMRDICGDMIARAHRDVEVYESIKRNI